ncbi:MAG: hypothetical protein ACFB10_10865 [Salibacteraceae bacterium]
MDNKLQSMEDCGAVTDNLNLIGEHVAGRDIHITVNSRPILVLDMLKPIGQRLLKLRPYWGLLLLLGGLFVLGWYGCSEPSGLVLRRATWALIPCGLLLRIGYPRRMPWLVTCSMMGGLLLWQVNPEYWVNDGCYARSGMAGPMALTGGFSIEASGPTHEMVAETVRFRVDSWQERIAASLPFTDRDASSADSLQDVLKRCGLPEDERAVHYYFSNNEEVLRSKWNLQRIGLNLSPENLLSEAGDAAGRCFQLPSGNPSSSSLTLGIFLPESVEYIIHDGKPLGNSGWQVPVEYTAPERLLTCDLEASPDVSRITLNSIQILGFKPIETYLFAFKGGHWEFIGLQ